MRLVVAILLLLPATAWASNHQPPLRKRESMDWHLMATTYGGRVTVTRNLTQRECEYIRDRVLELTAGEKHEDGTIKQVECFQ